MNQIASALTPIEVREAKLGDLPRHLTLYQTAEKDQGKFLFIFMLLLMLLLLIIMLINILIIWILYDQIPGWPLD